MIVPIVHIVINAKCTLVTWLKWWLTSTAENVPVDYWPVASAKIGSCNCSSPCRCVDVNMLIFIIGIIEFNLLTIVMESQLTTHHTSIIVIPLIPVVVNHSCPHSIVAHFHSSLHVTTTIHQSYISRRAVGWDWKGKKNSWRLSSDLVLYYHLYTISKVCHLWEYYAIFYLFSTSNYYYSIKHNANICCFCCWPSQITPLTRVTGQ